jgi:MarR family transcriptional regulator, organic hydroperoxide resistance regulator
VRDEGLDGVRNARQRQAHRTAVQTSTDDASDLGTALRNALRELRVELSINTRRVAAVSGLNESDLDVLDVLSREGPQSPTRLARRLGIHVATMTGVLARLEKAGWIMRRRDVVDRRSVQVESTGFDRLTATYREGNERLADIAARLSAEDGAVIVDYLRQACAAVRAASAGIPVGKLT